MCPQTIVIDDEPDFLESIRRGLITSGFKDVQLEKDPLQAIEIIEQGKDFDLALIDVTMPNMDEVSILERIKQQTPEKECIMVMAVNEAQMAVDCLKKGAWLHLPPLRERNGDVPLLVKAYLKEYGQSPEGPKSDPEALAALLGYDYPGNIRELQSIIQSSLNLSQGGVISLRHLPSQVIQETRARSQYPATQTSPRIPLAEVEREHILETYRVTGKNKALASRKLGIGLNTLRRKLEGYGIH
jgi:DNA-binding NtrC family response regulator